MCCVFGHEYWLVPADGSIDFATFLEVMHEHSEKEKCQQEVTAAFRAHDRGGQGSVPAGELFNILTRFGEKISEGEGNFWMFR